MQEQYNTLAKILHWAIAILIVINVGVALYMDDLPRAEKLPVIHFHISIGILILELVVIRIFWSFYKPGPALPETVPGKERKLAKILQHSLYLLMLLVPIVGYLNVITIGSDASFFGIYSLPSVLSKSKELHEIFEDTHAYLAWTIVAFASLHMLAGIRHILKKDGLFKRMWFSK